MEGIEKVSPTIEVSYVNDFSYHNNPEENYIRMNLMKNSHIIKSLSENLSANVDAIKIPPYSKYMKDIITNKRKIPNDAITTMLASYSFEGKFLKSVEILVFQLFLVLLKELM
jgi:hypothetical protein